MGTHSQVFGGQTSTYSSTVAVRLASLAKHSYRMCFTCSASALTCPFGFAC